MIHPQILIFSSLTTIPICPSSFPLGCMGIWPCLCSQVTGGVSTQVGIGLGLKRLTVKHKEYSQFFSAGSPCRMWSNCIVITKMLQSVPCVSDCLPGFTIVPVVKPRPKLPPSVGYQHFRVPTGKIGHIKGDFFSYRFIFYGIKLSIMACHIFFVCFFYSNSPFYLPSPNFLFL